MLREKGPHSGSAFSNPGLIADAPAGLKVAMKNADVKIHLRPGDGDTPNAGPAGQAATFARWTYL